jgi:hypothetical protein
MDIMTFAKFVRGYSVHGPRSYAGHVLADDLEISHGPDILLTSFCKSAQFLKIGVGARS